ncbi:TonB family protein [Sulfurimonas sp. SAG-AH-194-I05]|nr:energy transducer TonB [Sulfurimonas sp. SAG-AH-194-I05]MDF1875530.1 TonB family protein [Sulfurimonas sp. SAG-AH-194-I05]
MPLMIRHSSSILLSFLLHIAIIFFVVFLYKSIPEKKEHSEKRVKIILCNVIDEPIIEKKEKREKKETKTEKKKATKKKIIKKKEVIKKEIRKPKPVIENILKEEPKTTIIEKPIVIPQERNTTIVTKKEPTPTPKKSHKQYKKRIQKDYLNEHVQAITQLLKENLYYPRVARKRGVVGEVLIRFTLATDATVHSITVVSSEHKILSRAAIQTIENVAQDFPQPQEELILTLPIEYRLRR